MERIDTDDRIRLFGVRQNNLKNLNLELPLNQLIVITGLSGAGKSSLAFETLFAEGQRRYIETFSPYARQFLDRMDRPQVDRIENIPPAIAIQHRNTVRSSRSTVGTLTEICDYMRVVWPHVAQLRCKQCGRPVRKETPDLVWEEVFRQWPGAEVLITFVLELSEKLSVEETAELVQRQGYQRVWYQGRPIRLEEWTQQTTGKHPAALEIIQDRVRLLSEHRARFVEAAEQAYHFGKGRLQVRLFRTAEGTPPSEKEGPTILYFSRHLHCAHCDIEYRDPTVALFSFNHPLGACPQCHGFGRVIDIDYRRAIPNPDLSIEEGAIKPWQTGMGRECYWDLIRVCRAKGIPTDVPFRELDPEWQRYIIEGDPEYGKDPEHEWPYCWYGLKGYFRWLESRTYKMHVRVLLSRYRVYRTCPACQGSRFQPESLLYRIFPESEEEKSAIPLSGLTIADFYALPLPRALAVARALQRRFEGREQRHPVRVALEEVVRRLEYLIEVGLEYLTLDRAARTLSGGETERVSLATALGSELVNTLYVLDEPSVGLHPRDTNRLLRVLRRLRDLGNTVVVVEHDLSIIQAADHLLELGPGHGQSGGEIVFQGSVEEIQRSQRSLTGAYLSGRKTIPLRPRRPVRFSQNPSGTPRKDGNLPFLFLKHATKHNIRDLSVRIPLHRFVCITGVSGSGKTTLIQELLLPALLKQIYGEIPEPFQDRDVEELPEEEELWDAGLELDVPLELEGWESIDDVVWVDQSPAGRTPRSTPAIYVDALDPIRYLFAQTPQARSAGLDARAFSFNSTQGQCPRCRGNGFEKVEMQFLSDVYIRCPECDGRRYKPEVLKVRLDCPTLRRSWNIAELLEATVDEAVDFLSKLDHYYAYEAVDRLRCLQVVGLGYLQMGQPLHTLSGGENERIKLARHLAQSEAFSRSRPFESFSHLLFLFDEPTTGLHLEDVRQLVEVFQQLVDMGHSVVVIEHNPHFILCADWVIDLGPEGGDRGGQIVCEGPPEQIMACPQSYTGQALRQCLNSQRA